MVASWVLRDVGVCVCRVRERKGEATAGREVVNPTVGACVKGGRRGSRRDYNGKRGKQGKALWSGVG